MSPPSGFAKSRRPSRRDSCTSSRQVLMNNPAIAPDTTIYVGGDKFYMFDTDGNPK